MKFVMPKGVEIHSGKVRISFTLNGKREREVFKDMPVNQKTIDYAGKMRALVVEEIEHGIFDYGRRFPESTKVSGQVIAAASTPATPAPPLTPPPMASTGAQTPKTLTVAAGVKRMAPGHERTNSGKRHTSTTAAKQAM